LEGSEDFGAAEAASLQRRELRKARLQRAEGLDSSADAIALRVARVAITAEDAPEVGGDEDKAKRPLRVAGKKAAHPRPAALRAPEAVAAPPDDKQGPPSGRLAARVAPKRTIAPAAMTEAPPIAPRAKVSFAEVPVPTESGAKPRRGRFGAPRQ
jgi:hypothetical protein